MAVTGRAESVSISGPGASDIWWRRLAMAARSAGLVLLAVFYLASLGGPSLIADEADFANTLAGIGRKPWRERPIGFMALERAAVAVAGPSEVAIRLLPCLAAIAAVGATYAIARREFGDRAAVAASALLALGPTFLFHAHVAKHYTFEALFTCGLLLAYLKYRRRPAAGTLALYGAVALVAFGFSFASVFVIVTIAAVEMWHLRSRPRDLVAFLALHVLLGSAFGALYFGVHAATAGGWLKRYWVDYFPEGYGPFALARWTGSMTLALAGSLSGLKSGWAALACAAAGGLAAARRGRAIVPAVAAGALLVHILAAWTRLYPYGEPRLVLGLAPLAAVMVGAGLALLVPTRESPRAAWLALVGVLWVSFYPAVGRIREYATGGFRTEHVRDLVRQIEQSREPTDCIWICDGASYAFRYYWYRFTGLRAAPNVVWGGDAAHRPRPS